jgi:hypothetical protein
MLRLALLAALALPLAACGGEGTSISINAKDDGPDGNALVSSDGNGQVAIKAAGFEGKFKLPKIKIDADDFDVNGVKLYPGSTIRNLDLNSDKTGGKDEGGLSVRFESPAAPGTVLGWFRDAMTKRGFKVSAAADGLTGTTDEGDPFTLKLAAAGDGKSSGTLELRGDGN